MADQPTAPWWATFISIILTAIVSVIATLLFVHRNDLGTPGAPPGVGALLSDTLTYIPHILLLFGVLADIFTMEGVYSIPSLVGIISIPVNYLFTYFWAGIADTFTALYTLAAKPLGTPQVAPTAPLMGGAIGKYAGCYVQGFESLQSGYAPQTLVVTATIFSYYMFDLIANRSILDATATIVTFGTIFLAQSAVIGNCEVSGYVPISIFLKMAMALAEGMFVGGLSYATVQAQYPNRLPSSVLTGARGGAGSNFTFGGVNFPGGGGGSGGTINIPGFNLPGMPGYTGGGGTSGTAGTGCSAVPSVCPNGTFANTAASATANTAVGSTAGSAAAAGPSVSISTGLDGAVGAGKTIFEGKSINSPTDLSGDEAARIIGNAEVDRIIGESASNPGGVVPAMQQLAYSMIKK
jgi:hypothetical protein